MTKREEIREGIAIKLSIYALEAAWSLLGSIRKQVYLDQALAIMEYEHSQGVVIKGDRELPTDTNSTRTRHCFVSKEELHAFDTGYFSSQQDMIRDGYVAVESLIGQNESTIAPPMKVAGVITDGVP